MSILTVRISTYLSLILAKQELAHRAEMPSEKAETMVSAVAGILLAKRVDLDVSLNLLSRTSDLDRAALKRAESGERIPALGFWIDWADSLGTSLEAVLAEARKKAGKEAGVPPERRRLPGA